MKSYGIVLYNYNYITIKQYSSSTSGRVRGKCSWYLFNIARSRSNWGSEHLILGPWVRWWCCGAQGCAALDLSLTGAGGRRAAAGEEGDQDPSCQDSQVPCLTLAKLLGALRRPPLWEYVPCVLPFRAKLVLSRQRFRAVALSRPVSWFPAGTSHHQLTPPLH